MNDEEAIEILMSIGLMRSEAEVYQAMQSRYSLICQEIADISGLSKSSIYRVLSNLVDKGFVKRFDTYKNDRYRARPVSDALDDWTLKMRHRALPLIRQQRQTENLL